MVVDIAAKPAPFKVEKREGDVVLETSQIIAHVSLANGAVTFHRSRRQATAGRRAVPEAARQESLSASTPAPTKRSTVGPASERADEPERRRRRARAAQHGHRRAVRGVDAQLRRAVGQQWHHAPRRSEALWACFARPQDPRRGGQGRRLHGALLHRREAEARARREGHQLPVHPRPLQLAQGTARGEGAGHRLAA